MSSTITISTWMTVAMLASSEPQRFAIVIGHNEPDEPSRPVLRYADDDAIATHELLRDAGVDSVLLVRPDRETARLRPVIDIAGAPTKANVLTHYERLAARIRAAAESGRSTELLFFYSGHGDLDRGEAFVTLEDSRLRRRELVEDVLEPSPASRNHVIIDACRARHFLRRGPGGVRRPVESSFVESTQIDVPNTGFVLATAGESHEWEQYRAGIFSHQVRSALRGGADVNRDGTITYAELAAFLAAANDGLDGVFRPDFLVRPPIDAAPGASQSILRWPLESDRLVFDAGYVGHVFLQSKTGLRVIDVHAAPGLQVELRLPETRPLYVRSADGSFEWEVLLHGIVRLSKLVKRTLDYNEARGAEHAAFARLFGSPLSHGLVDTIEASWASAAITAQSSSRSATEIIRSSAPWIFVGAFSTGFVCTLLARDQLYNTILPRLEPDPTGEKYEYLNIGAITMYSIAGLTAAAWMYAAFAPDDEPSVPTLLVAPSFESDFNAASVSVLTIF